MSLTLLLLKSEPLSMRQGMLLMIVVMIIVFAGLGVGAYFFIRILASIVNRRRDEWEMIGTELGLTPDHKSGPINKDLVGTIDGLDVVVSRFAVPRGEYSADQYASVQVMHGVSFPFSFKVERIEMLYQKVASFFAENDEIGHDAFDKVFRSESSNTISLLQLLNTEIPGGETATLLNDLMITQKSVHRIIVTDSSVTISVRFETNDTDLIRKCFAKAKYLAERLTAAANHAH